MKNEISIRLDTNLLTLFQCVGHSWYLNVDMQLFILSPLLLLPLKKYRKTVIGLIIVLILASIAAAFEVAWRYDMPGVVGSKHG